LKCGEGKEDKSHLVQLWFVKALGEKKIFEDPKELLDKYVLFPEMTELC